MSTHLFTVSDAATFRTWVEDDGLRCMHWEDSAGRYSATLRFSQDGITAKRMADVLADLASATVLACRDDAA